jgi:hypothetical protein
LSPKDKTIRTQPSFFEKFVNKEHFENAVQMFGEKPHPLLGGADVRDWIL